MTASETKPKNGVSFPLVSVRGKIVKIITHQAKSGSNIYEHVVNLPSDDPYGFPPGLAVKAKRRMGNENEEVSFVANCIRRGYKDNSGNQRFNHEFWLHEDNNAGR